MTANGTAPDVSSAHRLPEETDVLIVGAGPVGSALAVDLRLRGVRCVVVEKGPGISYEMRAVNTDMRSMEHFRRWGVAEEVRACSRMPTAFQRDLVFCTALQGHELRVFPAYGFRFEDARSQAAEAAQPMPQKWTNGVLRDRAASLGAHVAGGWECIGLEQTHDAVIAEVAPTEEGGTPQTVRAAYAVGCDGSRSNVLGYAGIERSGEAGLGKHLHIVVQCPGLWSSLSLSPAAYYIVFNPEAGGIALPSAPDELNLHVPGFGADEDTSGLDLVSLARKFIGRDLDLEIGYVAPYFVHELVAETYRAGRVFVAGDAAHLFCPFGGFNMNTGIHDAGNLGWKLTAALEGWGGEELLDSYSDERRPVALSNCAQATFHVNTLNAAIGEVFASGVPEDTSEDADAARRELGRQLYEKTYREWQTAGVVLDQRYTGSSVVSHDGTSAPEWRPDAYQPCAKPGHRAPHVWSEDGRSLYDRFGPGFTLLDFGARRSDVRALVDAAALRRLPLDVLSIEDRGTRDLYEAALVLVRPDQVVAWRGTGAPDDPLDVIDTIRGAASTRVGQRARHPVSVRS